MKLRLKALTAAVRRAEDERDRRWLLLICRRYGVEEAEVRHELGRISTNQPNQRPNR